MYNYKLLIQYDGGRYNGWQKQGNTSDTIQEKIEEVIGRITGEKVELSASGRTDAGVHATGQVAGFKVEGRLLESAFLTEVNRYLPKDIRIIQAEEAELKFHARLNARKKTYVYRIDNTPYGNAFDRKYAMRFQEKLDIDRMRKAASHYIGEHDFKSFCTKRKMKKTTVRCIFDVEIADNNGMLEITYCGNGFLYNMVRILTGTLIDVGRGTLEPEDIPDILEACDRGKAGFTAPPEGLFLKALEY